MKLFPSGESDEGETVLLCRDEGLWVVDAGGQDMESAETTTVETTVAEDSDSQTTSVPNQTLVITFLYFLIFLVQSFTIKFCMNCRDFVSCQSTKKLPSKTDVSIVL